jgi:predicted  nucleic acid-binding Zn-ribbon protein
MAMPALKFEQESPMEERVAVLEANIGHIRSDIYDMKTDLRKLNEKFDGVDQKLTARIEGVDQRLTAKIDSVNEKLTAKIEGVDQKLSTKIDAVKDGLASLALTMEKSFSALKIGRALDRIWWLLMSAALLGIMARAFKWI